MSEPRRQAVPALALLASCASLGAVALLAAARGPQLGFEFPQLQQDEAFGRGVSILSNNLLALGLFLALALVGARAAVATDTAGAASPRAATGLVLGMAAVVFAMDIWQLADRMTALAGAIGTSPQRLMLLALPHGVLEFTAFALPLAAYGIGLNAASTTSLARRVLAAGLVGVAVLVAAAAVEASFFLPSLEGLR